jgi:hypothetical protein
MIGVGIGTGRERWCILAVVELGDHDAIDIALDEIDQDFTAHTRTNWLPQLGPDRASATRTQVPEASLPGALPFWSSRLPVSRRPPGLGPGRAASGIAP